MFLVEILGVRCHNRTVYLIPKFRYATPSAVADPGSTTRRAHILLSYQESIGLCIWDRVDPIGIGSAPVPH